MTPTRLSSILCLILLTTPLAIHPTPQPTPTQDHLSFAAFTDTHIGIRYQNPLMTTAHHLDSLADDLQTIPNLQFTLHLGDIINHNTAQTSGTALPHLVNQYTNNLKAYLLSHTHLPFYPIIGNHDVDDYQLNPDNPHNVTQAILDETSQATPTYAMMYNNILFLIVPELAIVTWTHPTLYAWIDAMTTTYHNTTTIICCHQAIRDTTQSDTNMSYQAKQDNAWWTDLFERNPQIIMWVHGHNHYQDWYEGNQSNGRTAPISSFGHPMIFSSPFAQTNWENHGGEDRIVIYNISSTSITAHAWNHTGTIGHWDQGYSYSFNVTTTYNTEAANWYAFPVFLQDNETQVYDQKLVSPNVTLQLIGTLPMELFLDPQMESPQGKEENILGFGNDSTDKVVWTDPGMRVSGPTMLTFPEKYPQQHSLQEDGRSGQPYHSFPMGTICAAVPGQTYAFTITAQCPNGNGRLALNVSCSDWGTKSQYSELANSSHCIVSHLFGSENETVTGVYTVPDDQDAWFLQGELQFDDAVTYDVSLFSVMRVNTSETTEDFHVLLNDQWYNTTGPLAPNSVVNFPIESSALSDNQGLMTFTSRIRGNCFGIVNLMFHEPLLLGANSRFRIDDADPQICNITLTGAVTHASPKVMRIWQSNLFQHYPKATELLVRLMLAFGMPSDCYSAASGIMPFEVVPFSSNPLYSSVHLITYDGSTIRHQASNGNLWWTCDGGVGRRISIRLDAS
jgi:hypothetical protein